MVVLMYVLNALALEPLVIQMINLVIAARDLAVTLKKSSACAPEIPASKFHAATVLIVA